MKALPSVEWVDFVYQHKPTLPRTSHHIAKSYAARTVTPAASLPSRKAEEISE